MPRHTHPPVRHKHSRAHTREQFARWHKKRWRQAKERYDYRADSHPELQRRNPDGPDSWWPFTLPANRFARNPYTRCSCWMCSVDPATRRLRRRREERDWREDFADAETEAAEGAVAPTVRRGPYQPPGLYF